MSKTSYLSKKGYVLKKNEFTVEELIKIKSKLKAVPLVDPKYPTTTPPFNLYIETQNKLYIPKMYGIKHFGKPSKTLDNYIGKSFESSQNITFNGKLRPYQEDIVDKMVDACKNKGGGILMASTGVGKCHSINTGILMYDGSIKMVQDIIVGDVIMGDDSTPRKILSLARGTDELYNVILETGESFKVNKEHILVLKHKNTFDIIEISVKNYLLQPASFKKNYKSFKVNVHFQQTAVPFDPYTIGNFIGNKEAEHTIITEEMCGKHFFKVITNLGLNENDGNIIPSVFKCNSSEHRLQLLAGLIDSKLNVTVSQNTKYIYLTFQHNTGLIDDMLYLFRSLGYCCVKVDFKLFVKGNTYKIPSKKYKLKYVNAYDISHLLYNTECKSVGVGEYYGFTIDNNNRYIMGDFTVTHNTICSIDIISKLQSKTIIVVNKIPLLNQWKNEITEFLPNANIGFIQGQKNIAIKGCDVVIAMLQSLSRIDYPDSFFDEFQLSIFDETHNLGSKEFSKILFNLCSKYTIGLSATPNRSDGCEYVFKWHLGEIEVVSSTERKGLYPVIKNYNLSSDNYIEICSENKYSGKKQIQYTSMISELIKMENRNKFIIKLIKDLIKQERKILLLSDRRSHLEELKRLLDNDNTVTFTYGLFLGSMKNKDLDISRASNCILATFAAFSEGVSEKNLDTLILLTPKKFIGHNNIKTGSNSGKNDSGKLEQIVGRIFRKDHTTLHPTIIDLQDNFSIYKNQSNSRKIFYKQHFKNGIFENIKVNLDDNSFTEKITKETKNIDITTKLKPNVNLIIDEI